MKDGALIVWLLSGLPLLGAVSSLLFWSNPARLQTLLLHLVCRQPWIDCGIFQPARDSLGRPLAALSPPADRRGLLVGATSSCRPSARVDHDLGLSRTGSRCDDDPASVFVCGLAVVVFRGRRLALSPPQCALVHILVGHRNIRARCLLRRPLARGRSSACLSRFGRGLRGPLAAHALPRWAPDGIDAIAGQPAVVHRVVAPDHRSPRARDRAADSPGCRGLDCRASSRWWAPSTAP